MSEFENLSLEVNIRGVALVTIDVPDRPVNVLTSGMYEDFHALIPKIVDDQRIKGVVICSGKKTFMAGGDLKRLVNLYAQKRSPEEAYRQSRQFTLALRKLELCGKPVAVAINGSAMGGGLELALACNYRVVVDEEKVLLGLPEVTLGLIPGAGGTQRLPRMVGLKTAGELILEGATFSPQKGLELGIVDEVVPREELISVAERLVLGCEDATRPWDRRGFAMPGGSGLTSPGIGALFQELNTRVAVTCHYKYPAPIAFLRCLFNGTTVQSMDKALEIESREFSQLTGKVESRNIIRTTFLNKGAMDRGAGRPVDEPRWEARCVSLVAPSGADCPESIERLLERRKIEKVGKDSNPDLIWMTGSTSSALIEGLIERHPQSTICVEDASALLNLDHPEVPIRVFGMKLHESGFGRCAELGYLSNSVDDVLLARSMDFCRQLRVTATRQRLRDRWFSDAYHAALRQEYSARLDSGVCSSALNNAARYSALSLSLDAIEDSAGCAALPDDQEHFFLAVCSLTAFRYLQEQNITAQDVDVLSVVGLGFPAWTGGVLSYIDTLGSQAFLERCEGLFSVNTDMELAGRELMQFSAENGEFYPAILH